MDFIQPEDEAVCRRSREDEAVCRRSWRTRPCADAAERTRPEYLRSHSHASLQFLGKELKNKDAGCSSSDGHRRQATIPHSSYVR
ncbi:hypothetical protein EYF80_056177 [Liparis tanakae]|uniref:Uncharacterized protein n=1 Tax=Liparis tanakae TaxID=230148 RepID=A0A4Z2EXH3_9TELE|nr:hypothetical protein EYF80_056177 [Liparis tanakae]